MYAISIVHIRKRVTQHKLLTTKIQGYRSFAEGGSWSSKQNKLQRIFQTAFQEAAVSRAPENTAELH